MKLWAFFAVCGLAIVSGPIGLLIGAGNRKAPAISSAPAAVNRGTAMAQIAAKDFLAGRPTAVPTAQGVSSSFSSSHPLPVQAMAFEGYDLEHNAVAGQSWQLNLFLVESSNRFYVLAVPTTADAAGRPVLAADPALMPAETATSNALPAISAAATAIPYGSNPPSLPTAVTGAIDRWSAAFASGNSSQLLALTGTKSGTYTGLGGFRVAPGTPPAVTSAYWTSPSKSTLLVHVRVVFASTRAKGYSTRDDYDLLITNTTSNTPNVVAWEPASVVGLQPYMNNSSLP